MHLRSLRAVAAPVVAGVTFLLVSSMVSVGIHPLGLGALPPLPPGGRVDYSRLRIGVSPLEQSFVRRVLGPERAEFAPRSPAARRNITTTFPDSPVERILDEHPATKDRMQDARTIPRPSFTARTTTSQATRDPNEPADCGSVGGTIWYRFRSAIVEGLVADTFGTRQSVILGVFEGGPGNLKLVGCDADVQGSAAVAFGARAGTDYYFQVTSPTGGGALVFNLDVQGITTLQSVSASGEPGNNVSAGPALSGDGRTLAFGSLATNIVARDEQPCIAHPPYVSTTNLIGKVLQDTQPCNQIFVRRRTTGKTTLASATPDGSPGDGHSIRGGQYSDDRTHHGGASVSYDGRFVAFASESDNLVPDDTNNIADAFVRDMWTGTIERVSVDSQGRQAGRNGLDGSITWVSISADGRYVSFASSAPDLVPAGEDTNRSPDVFVRDRLLGLTTRVSVSSTGQESALLADRASVDNQSPTQAFTMTPCLSANGRYVAFTSAAPNLVPGDTNQAIDVFVHDRATKKTERVSVNTAGHESNFQSSTFPGCISEDGRFVTFTSRATNLVAGDTNGIPDVFVRDRMRGVTLRVSVRSNGGQAETGDVGFRSRVAVISANGRYVAFHSTASDLVEGDQNALSDVFIHDLVTGTTTRVSSKPGGGEFTDGDALNPTISADGRIVAFDMARSGAYARNTAIVAPPQVYVHEWRALT